ncbi:MAG: T9SS type A sorting domain-containing protein, partial [Flavobacteriales bacterium]|nr:T9SS type A sorting domain-containing protein [Flavobacteriales bacterium]
TGGTPANVAWTLRPNGYNTAGSWGATLNSNDASQFYLTNSDAGGSGVSGLTFLSSPVMNLANFSAASLSFYHYYRDLGAADTARVQVTTNGGTSWTDVQVYNATTGAPTAWVIANISLNAYAGQSAVQLRFRYRSGWDYGWGIDNVSVTGTPNPYMYSWASTPSGFSSTNQNPTGVAVSPVPTTYTVTVSASGCPVSASVTVNPDNTDTDGDGFLDCVDNCPGLPGQQGDVCDADPGPGFLFGAIDGTCTCVAVPCTENVTVDLRTDLNSDDAGWEILLQSSAQVVCKGGYPDTPYANNITNPIVEGCCLPVGCYRLRVLDSAGDGFTSGGFTGGYQLRESGPTGRRIIDNFENFSTGSTSAISNVYENGAFCVPLSNDELIFSSCDKLDWVDYKYLVCHANAAVSAEWVPSGPNNVQDANSGYEFWIFDPNGSYSYRRFHAHNVSDGFSPASATRAARIKINGWYNSPSTPLIPANVMLNVRVRGRVNGVNGAFGPACRMKIDAARAACPLVKLQDDPTNVSDFSCGVTRAVGGPNSGANKLVALPPQFSPAPYGGGTGVRFQFRFRIPAENVCIVRPPQASPTIYLNWTNGPQLLCNKTYEVEVRVSKDLGATWCIDGASPACDPNPVTTWGKTCNVTTSVCFQGPGQSSMGTQGNGALTMYPNPNNGDQLTISLTEVARDVRTMSVDIYDLTGKRITARTIAVQDGFVTTVLDLNGDIANGMYMVNITAGEKTYTERLVIQK